MLQRFFQYLSTGGIEHINHFLLVSWILSFVSHSIDGTWIGSVFSYGFLWTLWNLSVIIGYFASSFIDKYKFRLPLIPIILAFLILGITNRFSLVLVCVSTIGLFSSMISKKDTHPIVTYIQGDNLDATGKLITQSNSDNRQDVMIQRQIVVFTFISLLSGVLYQEDWLYPNILPCLIIAIWFTGLFIIRCIRYKSSNVTSNPRYKRTSYLQNRPSLPRNPPPPTTTQLQSSKLSNNTLNKSHIPTLNLSSHSTKHAGTLSSSIIPTTTVSTVTLTMDDFKGVLKASYVDFYKGDVTKATEAYQKTLQWRKETQVDHIFDIPDEFFHEIITYYPHSIHGVSKDGAIVFYEQLGKAKLKQLSSLGVTPDVLTRHFLIRNEYVFRKYKSDTERDLTQIMTVLDVSGIGFTDITSDVISFIQKSSEVMDSHYPGRVKRTIICNAPMWFGSSWSLVARVLPDSVKNKVKIISGTSGLDEFIDSTQRPQEYGGNHGNLGKSSEHLGFLQLTENWKSNEVAAYNTSTTISQSSSGGGGGSGGNSHSKHRQKSNKKQHKKKNKVSSWPLNEDDSDEENHSDNDSDSDSSGYEFDQESTSHQSLLPTRSGNASSTRKGGIVSWIRSSFSSSSRPSIAYLGEKNSFKYDNVTKSWTLVADDKTMTEKSVMSDKHGQIGDNDDTKSDHHNSIITTAADTTINEEDKLILAIQAAQVANINTRHGHIPSSSDLEYALESSRISKAEFTGLSHINKEAYQHISSIINNNNNSSNNHSKRGIGGGGGSSNSNSNVFLSPRTDTKLSSNAFLLIILLYFATSTIESWMTVLLPVYMSTEVNKGGLGFSVINMSLVMSAGGLIAFIIHSYFKSRITYILKASPVRTLRVGCGAMVVLCLLTSPLLKLNRYLFIPTPHQHVNPIYSELNNPYDIITSKIQLIAVPLPALIFASIMMFVYIMAKASSILLYISLSPYFTSPYVMLATIHGLCSVSGPLLGSLLFISVLPYDLPSPMDASFFLAVSSAVCILVYGISLFISIQFRGDFGVLPDTSDVQENNQNTVFPSTRLSFNTTNSGNNTTTTHMSKRNSFSNLTSVRGTTINSNTRQTMSYMPLSTNTNNNRLINTSTDIPSTTVSNTAISSTGLNMDLLEIPRGDLSLLFSSPVAGYGTKLHNVKMSVKDV